MENEAPSLAKPRPPSPKEEPLSVLTKQPEETKEVQETADPVPKVAASPAKPPKIDFNSSGLKPIIEKDERLETESHNKQNEHATNKDSEPSKSTDRS